MPPLPRPKSHSTMTSSVATRDGHYPHACSPPKWHPPQAAESSEYVLQSRNCRNQLVQEAEREVKTLVVMLLFAISVLRTKTVGQFRRARRF